MKYIGSTAASRFPVNWRKFFLRVSEKHIEHTNKRIRDNRPKWWWLKTFLEYRSNSESRTNLNSRKCAPGDASNLTPCDVSLFLKLNDRLKDMCFESNEQVKHAIDVVNNWINSSVVVCNNGGSMAEVLHRQWWLNQKISYLFKGEHFKVSCPCKIFHFYLLTK